MAGGLCQNGHAMATMSEFSRREFLAAVPAGMAACAGREAEPDPGALPNIVLCMGDDHGWHETGYRDHPVLQTPVLDEMASSGLRFDRFYSAAPVCSPTRGSVMTGRHPNRYGTYSANWSIRPEEVGIASVLRGAGYACGHFGKWHLGPVKTGSPTNPGALGFDEWLSHDNFFEMDPYLSRNGGPPEIHRGESSRIIVEAASEFMDRAVAEGRPFFVVIWFGSPHEPYVGLESDLARYDQLPADLAGQTARITSLETGLPADLPLDRVLQARFAEITAMDRALGLLRGHLQDQGHRENTLLWYCSDNGAPGASRFESPMRADKGSVYDGGIRVPSVLEWPERIPAPRTTAMPAVTSDILPTLCDLSGLPVPNRPLDGISLLPLLDGEMDERPEPICFWRFGGNLMGNGQPYIDPELQAGTTPLVKQMDGRLTRNFRNYHHPEVAPEDMEGPRAILDNGLKLVVDGEGEGTRELFDLRSDPAETTSLLADQSAVGEALEQRLEAWQQSVLESLTGADYEGGAA